MNRGHLSLGPVVAAVLIAMTAGVAVFGHANLPALAFLIPSAVVATLLGCVATGVILIVTLRTRWCPFRLALAGAYLSSALITALLLLVAKFVDGNQIIVAPPHFALWILQLWQAVLGAYTLAYAGFRLGIQRGAAVPGRRQISIILWTSVVALPLLTIAASWVLGTRVTGTVIAPNARGIAIMIELFVATAAVALVKGDRIDRAYTLATLASSLAYLLDIYDHPVTIAQYGEMCLYIVWGFAVLVAAVYELLGAYEKLGRTEEALVEHTRRLGAIAREADLESRSELPNRAAFRAEIEPGLEAARTMRRMLADGIEAGELTVFYQPTIELSDGRPSGAEALVRWRHPMRGLIGPDDFIPFAEQNGLISGIGTWVLQRVAADVMELGERLGTARIFINLSLNQVDDSTLTTEVAALLNRYPGLAQRIGFEITESAAMRDTEHTIRTLSAIRALGIPFALDDFGTGYSSLAHLKRLPINAIKIDRTFVAGIPGDEHDAALIEAQFAIARQFGYDTHAEGVEHEEQLSWLRALGCCYAQGFLIAPPMPFDDYCVWLNACERNGAIRA
jgi:EAL domain-containing protein (putative c-di-GMP-specific phosphodiesterase class I)